LFRHLTSLSSLDVSFNRLKIFPSECSQLRCLDITDNYDLVTLPPFLKGNESLYLMTNLPDLIIDGFWIGSVDCILHSGKILRKLGISHVLTVCKEVSPSILGDLEAHFSWKQIPINDTSTANITSYFDDCFQFIESGIKKGGVIVHCWQGKSRSASICILYLMKALQLPFDEAFTKLKFVRPSIDPNPGFIQQIKIYESKLKKFQ